VIAIVGAGLIGLSLAYELARRGADVRVYDAGEPGAAASWAGAGMLAPDSEHAASPELHAFCRYSLGLYPQYVADLSGDSGVDSRLRLNGVLALAATTDEAERLRARSVALARSGSSVRWLERSEALALEPSAGSIAGAALFEHEGQVDNRRLGRALKAACERCGVTLVANCGALEIDADARRVRGLHTREGFVSTSLVVNAAGAWSAALPGIPAHARVATYPVKGQMLALAMPHHLVRHPIWYSGGYVVPRDDGRLLVGATVEDVGFDVRVTAEGVSGLLNAALKALPALRDLAVSETWAGLRPGSADGLPYIGFGALGGYAVAAGHHRNGILLAPATARSLADLIERKPPAVDLAPFSPLRADARSRAANESA
jgi:glycine oxidase